MSIFDKIISITLVTWSLFSYAATPTSNVRRDRKQALSNEALQAENGRLQGEIDRWTGRQDQLKDNITKRNNQIAENNAEISDKSPGGGTHAAAKAGDEKNGNTNFQDQLAGEVAQLQAENAKLKDENKKDEDEIKRIQKDEINPRQGQIAANNASMQDPEKQGGSGGGGGEEKGGQPPPPPPPPKNEDKGDSNQPTPPESAEAKMPEEPKPIELPKEEEEQIIALPEKEEEEIKELPEIQVPQFEIPVPEQQIPVEQTAEVKQPVQPAEVATSVPGRNSIVVDESAPPGGAQASAPSIPAPAGGGGGGGEGGNFNVGGVNLDLPPEDGQRGIASFSEAYGGGGGGGGEGDGGGGGSMFDSMMANLSGGGTINLGDLTTTGGTLVSGAAAESTKAGVAEITVSRAMAAFLEMNNRRICSTRKHRNRIAEPGIKAAKGYVPSGFHERIGKKIEWDVKNRAAQSSKGPKEAVKATLNSGRAR